MSLNKFGIQFFIKSLMKLGFFLATFLLAGLAFGQDSTALVPINPATTSKGLAGVAENVTGSFKGLAQLMLAIAYIAGIGFAVASLFKFKQHKDNPTQIPLGTPIALLVIAISLIFVAYFIEPLGETLGAKPEHAGGPKGTATLPGMK